MKLLFLLLLMFFFESCHVGRFVIYNFADINDYKKFPKNEIKKAEIPFNFIDATNFNLLKLPKGFNTHQSKNFEEAIENSGTVAFLAIRNDSILYEWYAPNYQASSIVPSFSMAKSYVSALVGIAIDEGKIKNTNEPIINYLTFLDKQKFGKITIQHLLDMQSGIKNNESYINPFGDIAKYYYGKNLKKYMTQLKIDSEPGKKFEYISLNTQLLGLIIEKATGKTLSDYLQQKIWSKIGTEFDASWSIDSKKNKTEKAFCCLNARAKDYAKFGRLYLNKGNWQGTQLISKKWISESVNVTTLKNNFLYTNQWWHTRNVTQTTDTQNMARPFTVINFKGKDDIIKTYVASPTGHFHAEGILGQYIYVAPQKNIIFVRLGKKEGWINWWDTFKNLVDKN